MFKNRAKAVVRITAALLAAGTLSACLFASGAGKAAGKAADKATPTANASRWIYFIRRSDNRLLRSHPDGSGKAPVSDVKAYSYAVAGQWIFYLADNQSGIYKIHGNGTEKTRISRYNAGIMGISGNNLLVTYTAKKDSTGDASSTMYRMTLDGKNFRKLCKDYVYDDAYKVFGGYVYYVGCDSNLSLVRIRADGTGRINLTKPLGFPSYNTFTINQNTVYFITDVKSNNTGSIYKMRLNGSGKASLGIKDACSVSTVDGAIYYEASSGKVYKIKADGTGKTLIKSSSWTAARAFNSNDYEQFQS